MEEEKEQLKPRVRDLRNGDWYWANKLVLDHPYLTSSAKVVYHALAYFANNSTQKSYPSIKKIQQLAGLGSRTTVISSIRQLEKYHFIETEKEKGKITKYILLKLIDNKVIKKVVQKMDHFMPGVGWLRGGPK